MKGYIPISRSFFDSPFWSEERDYSRAEAWLDLIQRSRFEAGVQVVKNSVIELERGEQIASLRYLGKRWQWDKGRVGRFITLLEKMGQVRQEMRQGQSVLTLCNYDKYNSSKNGAIPLNETPNETRVRQQRDTSETKKKKGNKENKVKEEALPHADLFSQAWVSWKQFRIEKKAKLTPSTMNAQLNKLGAMSEQDAVLTIQQSIENGWQGLFPDKITGSKANTSLNKPNQYKAS